MSLSVLVVEDDRNFQKLLEIRLRRWRSDVEITFAKSLQAARDILDSTKSGFSLVILDQHLPDGLGSSLFSHKKLEESAVLAVSADEAPEIPGAAVKAGARHFLGKRQISEPLFIPLLEALIERKKLESKLLKAQIQKSRMFTIRTLLSTLQHEINNPLGAVLGGAYLIRESGTLEKDQKDALRLIEESGNRIKHVITKLCEAAELEEVAKGREQLFHVPGDPKWNSKNKKS